MWLRSRLHTKRLQPEADLTLNRALDVAQAMETVAKDALELQTLQNEAAVHKLKEGKGPSRPARLLQSRTNQEIKSHATGAMGLISPLISANLETKYATHVPKSQQRVYLQKKHSDLKKKLHYVDKNDDSDDEYVISTLSE